MAVSEFQKYMFFFYFSNFVHILLLKLKFPSFSFVEDFLDYSKKILARIYCFGRNFKTQTKRTNTEERKILQLQDMEAKEKTAEQQV